MITRETDYALRLLRTRRDGERRTAAEAAERERSVRRPPAERYRGRRRCRCWEVRRRHEVSEMRH